VTVEAPIVWLAVVSRFRPTVRDADARGRTNDGWWGDAALAAAPGLNPRHLSAVHRVARPALRPTAGPFPSRRAGPVHVLRWARIWTAPISIGTVVSANRVRRGPWTPIALRTGRPEGQAPADRPCRYGLGRLTLSPCWPGSRDRHTGLAL